jgi:MerR family mercuric resistance operon transcriptional regulator
MMNETMTIGRVAEAAGVNVESLRYYQRRGLVGVPRKPPGGQRQYGPAVVARVRFIKRAQHLGFTLGEITNLLRLEDGQACRETRLLAEQKLSQIEERIADLTRMRRTLKGLIDECAAGQRPRSCPIIASLSAESEELDR